MTEQRDPISPAMAASVKAFFEKLGKNVCPHCNRAIEIQRQVGRCVFAHPCGHRLYQGEVGAFAPQPKKKTP